MNVRLNQFLDRIANQGVCITGTDTEVGKTWFAGSYAYILKQEGFPVSVFKAVQSGVADNQLTDAHILKVLSEDDAHVCEICPNSFQAPVAPVVAARREGRILHYESAIEQIRRRLSFGQPLLIEGAGGISVQLGDDFDLARIANFLKIPILIVARSSLGTVNHTVLTIEYARMKGLEVLGVVMNDQTREDPAFIIENINMIEQMTGVPVVAVMPYVQNKWEYREQLVQLYRQDGPVYEMGEVT